MWHMQHTVKSENNKILHLRVNLSVLSIKVTPVCVSSNWKPAASPVLMTKNIHETVLELEIIVIEQQSESFVWFQGEK